MSFRPAARFSPIARLSLGLVAIFVSLFMLADMLLVGVSGQGDVERRTRRVTAENLAAQLAVLVEANERDAISRTLDALVRRDPQVREITLRRADGLPIAQAGTMAQSTERRSGVPGNDELRVPISSARTVWGEVGIRYAPPARSQLMQWLKEPSLQIMALMAIGGFLICYAYLRRAMHYLNPSASVPDRVRKAFDSLAEGLVIVDQQARIVLANQKFREIQNPIEADLNGKPIGTVEWLRDALPDGTAPWQHTLNTGEAVDDIAISIPIPGGASKRFLMTTAAVTDARGKARGCMLTFDNVTAVHEANQELRSALSDLERSRRRVEEQNAELRHLASRDPLTGAYNRRAFFELASELFLQARTGHTALCCMMVDIDHFKQFNDNYGHAVGDQVIQVVVRTIQAKLRQRDLLGRYGGEEFCVVLPGATAQVALSVAERMRVEIEATANRSIRGIDVMPITASFGVAAIGGANRLIEDLIDQSDQALYQSKQSGRNRVTLWEPKGAEPLDGV